MHISTSLSIPCTHEIVLAGDGPILPDLIFHHWRLHYIPVDMETNVEKLQVDRLRFLQEQPDLNAAYV